MDARLQLRVQRYGWERAAAVYDTAWRGPLTPAQDLLLEMAALEPGEEVLETACGSGLVTHRVARAVSPTGRVVGTDLSQGMLDEAEVAAAEAELEHVTFQRMNAESLDLPDASFDVVLCSLGLMYVPDPEAAIREMGRVLRPGGRAVAAVWGERSRCGWAEVFPIVDARVNTEVCPLFFQLGTRDTLKNQLEDAGFHGVEVRRIQVTLPFASQEEALEAAFAGGPVAMAYSRFDRGTRDEIHEAYLESIAAFRTPEGYRIPGEFVVVRGERPG